MRFVIPLFIFAALLTLPARAADAPKPRPFAAQLAREADALIASAIKRPYGWGWAQSQPADNPKTPGNRIPVSLEPGATPSAGLVLLYAAEVLKDPKYADAARNVARGVAAAQLPSGQFPAVALFGTTAATSKEPAAPLPDRAATRASLALLLSLIDTPDQQQELLGRAASRAARWLLKQQSEPGGWPIMFPPGSTPQDATRIVRLDTTDMRDSLLAMLLAYEVLGDPFQRRSAERSVEFLIKVRSGLGLEIGPGLWSPAYTLSAMPVEKSLGFPTGYDTLASRHAMQGIFAVWVILGDGQRLTACDLASRSLQDLIKNDDGQWHRRFDSKGLSNDTQATTRSAGSTFGTGAPEESAPPEAADPLFAPTINAIAIAKEAGREKYRERLRAEAPLKQHLAEVVSGLTGEVMTADFPTAPEQVAGYLKQHEAVFRLIDAGVEPDGPLAARVARLWAIYLRAVLENRFEN